MGARYFQPPNFFVLRPFDVSLNLQVISENPNDCRTDTDVIKQFATSLFYFT